VFGAMLALVFLVLPGACCNGREARPNLLLIVSDALRADVLGCYGGAARTPNIDRLAGGGARFERCYSTTPWTLPAAVSMFTGNYPAAYHPTVEKLFAQERPKAPPVTVFYVPEEEQLWGEALAAAGYQVRMALQNPLPRRSNSLQGFVDLDPAAVTAKRKAVVEQVTGPDPRQAGPYLALLDFLAEVPDDQPFCLLGWVLDPHGEYDPPRRFLPAIGADQQPLPREHRYYAGLNSRQLKDATAELDERERAYIRALYLAEVEYVDQRVGRILAMLENRGLLEKTLIVFTADHGEAFWEHGFPSHGNTYFEEMVRVPLIFSGPGISGGRRVDAPVSHLGLAPTLAELLGVDVPGEVQGSSFAGLLFGSPSSSRMLYFTGAHQQLHEDAILDGSFKLITGRDGSGALYDLATDPGEQQDLAADLPGVAQRLAAGLVRIREENRRLRQSRPKQAAAGDSAPDTQLLEQMKALGYVE
jgi:arylsulfatase